MKTETIAKFGRIWLEKLDDDATPYLFAIKVDGQEFTATPACVQGEGEIEGNNLTQGEADWAFRLCDKLDI